MRSRLVILNKGKSSHSILRKMIHSTPKISQPELRQRMGRNDDEEWRGQGDGDFKEGIGFFLMRYRLTVCTGFSGSQLAVVNV
jgi:hypothetical protein